MTVNIDENKVENTLIQDKVDTQMSQQKPDINQIQENKSNDGSQEDPNWRAFREARKKDRSEKEAAERKSAEKQAEIVALKAAMEAAFSKSNPPQQQYYSEPGSYQQEETEDERIEKKVQAVMAIRDAASEKARAEREHQEYPNKLTKSFPDFHQTISQDNLDYLDYHYPEVSRPLQRLGDGFDKWSDIYQAIKKFVPNSTSSKREANKADINHNKPKSISSSSMTNTGESTTISRLTEEKRASNWERMQRILKGVS